MDRRAIVKSSVLALATTRAQAQTALALTEL